MANESSTDFSQAIDNLMQTVGKMAQMQVDILNNGIKTAASIIEPMNKTSLDLLGNVTNALNQALQSVSSAITPKK